jgi:predicted  nucleic acid-binding Zn-ribbon protein
MMQIEPPTANNSLSLIGGVVVSIVTVLGLGNLLLAVYNRVTGKNDKLQSLHESNQGKLIDADILFKQSFIDRLSRVEDKLDKAQSQLSEQLAMNADLLDQNKTLAETNALQAARIKSLEESERQLGDQIRTLTNTVIRLESEITTLQELHKAK